jgi:tetratricopeptide (TPR) repeat protein
VNDVQRRLAAILVADVVGYSRLMSQDDKGTLKALNERRKSILEPVVKAHSGRIVKLMGDGVLVEFASAVKAVEAALDLQGEFSASNEGHAKEHWIQLRIGINLGEVIGEGSDIFGDAETGAHLWADRFDGALAEVFDLQDQVAASVVNAIMPRMEQAEIERAKRKPTERLDAYDHYLRGLSFADQFAKEANTEALRLFNKAIELDQNFALAYARGAWCYAYRKANDWTVDHTKEVAEAAHLARRAVDLGRDDAVALTYGGFVLGYVVGDLKDSAAFVDRALVLNPNLAAAWGASGCIKLWLGEPDTAIKHASTALRLSPLDPMAFAWEHYIAFGHFCTGRYDDATAWEERVLRAQPNYRAGLRVLIASHALSGRVIEAQKLMEHLRQLAPGLRLSNLAETMPPLRRAEDRAKYTEGLREAGLPE